MLEAESGKEMENSFGRSPNKRRVYVARPAQSVPRFHIQGNRDSDLKGVASGK
jgi:hypothetical protein